MAETYSPRKFLRQAPNSLLRRYFQQHSIGDDIAWDGLPEGDIESVFRAMQTAEESANRECDSDFREIYDLADESGIRTLIDEGRHPKHQIDLAPIFEPMSGPLEQAFWTFLEHPDVFNVARKLDYASTQHFEKREYVPTVEIVSDSGPTNQFETALSEYYCSSEGRGRGCKVEKYTWGDKYYYFCYLEDYARTEQVWTDAHELQPQKQKPTFEIILIYNPVERTLESMVKGRKRVRTEVERIFGRTVLALDLGEPPDPGDLYDLRGLLDRDSEFPTDPQHGITRVCVRRLKLRIMGTEHRTVTLEVGAATPGNAIWDLMDQSVRGVEKGPDGTITEHGIPKALLSVMRATIRVVFRPQNRGRAPTLTFDVARPRTCTLKYDAKDELLKEYLKRWGLDTSGRDQSYPPMPGLSAQYRLWPG